MKKIFLLFLTLFSIASAEILVMGVDLDTIDKHYIQLSVSGGFTGKVYAYVDYGQGGLDRNHAVISRSGGKQKFDSTIDILNHFYDHGWELKAAVSEPYGGSDGSSVNADTYYILEQMDKK